MMLFFLPITLVHYELCGGEMSRQINSVFRPEWGVGSVIWCGQLTNGGGGVSNGVLMGSIGGGFVSI